MTRATKRASLPVDHDAAAREADRRQELANSAPYKRGLAQAHANELFNVRTEFAARIADLKKATLRRDATQAGRDSYDRCWQKCFKVGERLKSITGEKILMPAHLPPPGPEEQKMVEIAGPAVDLGTYRETKGRGVSGQGLPLTGPGSNVDPDWLDKK